MRFNIFLLFLFVSLFFNNIFAWTGEFAISCSENGWPDPTSISSLNSFWKFGGTDNNPASGSVNKILTLTCVSSPTNAGEINPGTFYFRIIHLEGSNWYSWGSDGIVDEQIILNDPTETIICPSSNYTNSKSAYFTATLGKTYQILFQANPNGGGLTSNICVLEFDGATATITSVTDIGPVNAGQDLIVTVQTSLSPPPPDQKFWLRYVYNNGSWSNASFVGNTISSGNSVQLTIPGQSSGGTVSYYAFTTESSIVPSNSNVDRATLWLNGYTDNTFDQSLPVSLSSFNVKITYNSIRLTWATQSEIDVMGYEIQRATDENGPFHIIASFKTDPALKAVGNSSARIDYQYHDSNVLTGVTYWYKLIAHDIDGSKQTFGPISAKLQNNNGDLQTINSSIPEKLTLEQNFPNPFNLSTEIRFTVPTATNVQLTIFDLNGKKIIDLLNEAIEPGQYKINWNVKDAAGKIVPSGVYFYRLIQGNNVLSRKMLLTK